MLNPTIGLPISYLRFLNRYYPIGLWKRYAKLFQAFPSSSSILTLSFDCDTDQDIDVVWDVHSRLMDINILPVYAVPGDLLKRGEKVYTRIFETGAQFINHGGREHTYFDKKLNRHASCFFL